MEGKDIGQRTVEAMATRRPKRRDHRRPDPWSFKGQTKDELLEGSVLGPPTPKTLRDSSYVLKVGGPHQHVERIDQGHDGFGTPISDVGSAKESLSEVESLQDLIGEGSGMTQAGLGGDGAGSHMEEVFGDHRKPKLHSKGRPRVEFPKKKPSKAQRMAQKARHEAARGDMVSRDIPLMDEFIERRKSGEDVDEMVDFIAPDIPQIRHIALDRYFVNGSLNEHGRHLMRHPSHLRPGERELREEIVLFYWDVNRFHEKPYAAMKSATGLSEKQVRAVVEKWAGEAMDTGLLPTRIAEQEALAELRFQGRAKHIENLWDGQVQAHRVAVSKLGSCSGAEAARIMKIFQDAALTLSGEASNITARTDARAMSDEDLERQVQKGSGELSVIEGSAKEADKAAEKGSA